MNSRGRNFLFGRVQSRFCPTSQGAGMRKLFLQVVGPALSAASPNPTATLMHACGRPVIKIVSDSPRTQQFPHNEQREMKEPFSGKKGPGYKYGITSSTTTPLGCWAGGQRCPQRTAGTPRPSAWGHLGTFGIPNWPPGCMQCSVPRDKASLVPWVFWRYRASSQSFTQTTPITNQKCMRATRVSTKEELQGGWHPAGSNYPRSRARRRRAWSCGLCEESREQRGFVRPGTSRLAAPFNPPRLPGPL